MRLADYYSDTDPQALELFVSLQRERPASQKIADVLAMSAMLLQLSLADVRRTFPEAGFLLACRPGDPVTVAHSA